MSETNLNERRLFLLDAFALIYRAHFAFIRAPRINSKGQNTSAIFGFTNTLLDILNNEKPTHIGIVYDTDKPTFRHEQFTAYKANRQEQPEDISFAIPYILKIAEGLGIPNLYLDGFEADDIIGTLAKKAACTEFTVFMMTPDKDFAQLVEPCIYQYKPSYQGKGVEVYGVDEIKQKWEIERVDQVIDILGLMGDAVDNIPGVPGVGEKTAKKLIQEFGSVENLVQNTDKLKGKLKEQVENFREQALLSKQLATIDTNVPIELDESALKLSAPNIELLKELFNELEFRALGKRIFGETEDRNANGQPAELQAPKPKNVQIGLFDFEANESGEETVKIYDTIDNTPHDYTLIETEDERKKLAEYLKQFKSVSFDTETSNIDPHNCNIVGFSFAVKPGEAFYIHTPGPEEDDKKILNEFHEIFESEEIEKVGQNIKFDAIILKNYGIQLRGPLFDTMMAHYLIDADSRHNLDLLAEKYLNYSPISIDTLIGKGRSQISMSQLPAERIRDYASEDADVALKLSEKLKPEVAEANANKLLQEVELPLIYVLADMEREGVKLDVTALQNYSLQLKSELRELETHIYELAEMPFNINSPIQLGEILFERMKLDPKAKRTSKSKQYSTNEEVLSALAPKHAIAAKILEYRSLQKLKSTYVDALPLLINKRTGRIHTSYNQAVAATGRLSSTDPNLQNIPIRTEKGREIRKAFIPRDNDHLILSADYSQIELRLIAEISGDEAMIEAFRTKQDIHTATAAKIFDVSLEEVSSDMRRKAKMVNFGIIYGISAFGLSQRLGISRSEAAEIISQYNKQYPRINQYLHDMVSFAQRNGYVETLLGRRRYLRDINSRNATQRGYAERNAINAPIQGSAADMIKVAMINIQKEIKARNLKTRMILQVHDELIFDAYKPEIEEVKLFVEDKMKNALKLNIPIEVEMGTGENWLEAH